MKPWRVASGADNLKTRDSGRGTRDSEAKAKLVTTEPQLTQSRNLLFLSVLSASAVNHFGLSIFKSLEPQSH